MKVDLSGKVAIVTGGNQGIGKAIAKLLLENSATVVIAARNVEKLKKTAEEFASLGTCRYIPTDVSSRESVENLINSTVEEFGKIDICFNNAGVNVGGEGRVDIDEFTQENWDKIIAIDLNGVFHCSQVVSRVMIKQKSGKIINVGSVFGHVAARKQIGFVAAKGGVHHMTKGMALELAQHGITVNCIAPGSVPVDMALFEGPNAPWAKFRDNMLSHIPLKRFGTVEDIANAALFLASDESAYITGHVLLVDGGWTCGYARDF